MHESDEVGDLLREEWMTDIESLIEGRTVQGSLGDVFGNTCFMKGGNEGWRHDVIPL